MYSCSVAAAVFVATLVPFLAEAVPAEPSLSLSLEQALVRAEQHSPLVQRARLERKIAAAASVGAAILFPANPAISAAVGRRTDTSGSTPLAQGVEFALRLEQTIEIGGQRGTRLEEAGAALRTAEARERLAVFETRARTKVAYLSGLIAQAQLDRSRRMEELAEHLLDSARSRLQAGAASNVELHLAEVERGRLRAVRRDAELLLADAITELRRQTDTPLGTHIILTTQLVRPPVSAMPLDQLLERARGRRAELRVLDERHSQLDAMVVRLHREAIPNPTLFVDFARQQPGQTYVGGGLGLTLPMWRRNQGELALVRAEQHLVEGQRDILDREVGIEIERALRVGLARATEAELWEREVVPAAEANVELLTEGWRAGKFDLFRVIQASREAGEARQRQLDLLGGLWQAVIELDRATGGMP